MRFLVLVVTSFAVASPAFSGVQKDSFALKGEVYPTAFKIEMKNAANKKLTTVKAGVYRMKVEDPSTIHNFRLIGPGLNRATSVVGKTETVCTVRLKRGTYRFLCSGDPESFRRIGTRFLQLPLGEVRHVEVAPEGMRRAA